VKTKAVSCLLGIVAVLFATRIPAHEAKISIETPMPPPGWALLERELLKANTAACQEFFEKYFDERGYLLCVERWGVVTEAACKTVFTQRFKLSGMRWKDAGGQAVLQLRLLHLSGIWEEARSVSLLYQQQHLTVPYTHDGQKSEQNAA